MNYLTLATKNDINFANQNDFHDIKNLWHICFHDNMSYIDDFFTHISFTSSNLDNQILVKRVNHKIVSMMFLLGSTINIGDITYPCIYLFAVATYPDYRGHGYMRELEEIACKYAVSRSIFHITLVPQDKPLFDLYAKLGYTTNFYINKTTINSITSNEDYTSENVYIEKIADKAFFNMRNNYLDTLPFYCRLNDDKNSFLYYDFVYSNITPYLIKLKNNSYYGLIKTSSSTMTILETSIPKDTLGLHHVFYTIARYLSCTTIKVISPVTTTENSKDKSAYGMYKYLGDNPIFQDLHNNGYMNFMLL